MKKHCLSASAAIAATVVTAGAHAGAVRAPIKANGTTCFNGYGYDLDNGAYRYTAHNEQTRVAGKLTDWQVIYVGANGEAIARKQLDFRANQTVPVYTLTIPREGYLEGIRRTDSGWTMVRRPSENAEHETGDFTIRPPMADDAGFNNLVKRHFAELMGGKTVKFRFVAAGRQSVLDLKASKIGTTTFQGQNAVIFKAELDMFLVHFFVDSLKLTYNPDTRRLLEYRGIGNLHDKSGETYAVRVDYYPEMPKAARQSGAPGAACGSVDWQRPGH